MWRAGVAILLALALTVPNVESTSPAHDYICCPTCTGSLSSSSATTLVISTVIDSITFESPTLLSEVRVPPAWSDPERACCKPCNRPPAVHAQLALVVRLANQFLPYRIIIAVIMFRVLISSTQCADPHHQPARHRHLRVGPAGAGHYPRRLADPRPAAARRRAV